MSERHERDETDRHHDEADDDPPFDIVQAVSDFVENVIDEGDDDTRAPDEPGD